MDPSLREPSALSGTTSLASVANTDIVPSSPPNQTVSASAVAVSPNGNFVAAVNPDSNSITLVDSVSLEILTEIHVGQDPRTLCFTPDSKKVLVTNHGSGTLSILDIAQSDEIAQYSVGSMPYGVVTDGTRAYVSEYGQSALSVIDLETGALLKRVQVDPFPAGLALTRNGDRLFITHFFTGRVTAFYLPTSTVTGITSTGNDTNLSQFIAVSPDGKKAYLPQTRSNVTNRARLFDTTVFPVVNVLELTSMRLMVKERITLDTPDEPVNMPFAVALSPDGNTLFLANAGSDDISVIDLSTNRGIAHLNVGANPRGIAITPDGSRVFANNTLDGTLSVIDTTALNVTAQITLTEIPLASSLLQGKRIFNSAAAPSLTNDNWISCATCHFDGSMDTRTWLGFPDGPRNTPALFGVSQTLPMHWSGNFDELQDVEITIREIQFGQGLITGNNHDSLGQPHAGISSELEALSAYLSSIEFHPTPYAGDTATIQRGNSLFATLGCDTCHTPPLYTDLKLHDVGTGDPTIRRRSHDLGTKFDTPSLRGVWLTNPYFHDGSAATLQQVLQTGTIHNVFNKINREELEALTTFLRTLPNNKPHPD